MVRKYGDRYFRCPLEGSFEQPEARQAVTLFPERELLVRVQHGSLGDIMKIKIKDVPDAEANGVKWLMASGVKNKEEALTLAATFIGYIDETKQMLDNEC